MFFFQDSEKIKAIPVIQIEPKRSQPRRCFSKEELQTLSNSIKENGLLHPVSVRKVFASKFELISGERRLRAAIMAGFKTIPCLIFDCDETQAALIALLENSQRSELQFFEEAEAIHRAIDIWGLKQEVIAQKLGKTQATVSNKLRLLKIKKEQRKKITEANLTERHARALLRLKSDEQREDVLNKIILYGLNINATEILIDKILESKDYSTVNSTFLEDNVNKFFNFMREYEEDLIFSEKEDDKYKEYLIKKPKETAKKSEESA